MAISPYIGFLVGMSEILQNLVYLSATIIPLGQVFTVILNASSSRYEPLYWLIFYATILPFHLRGGRVFWWFCSFIGAISLLGIVLYILVTARFADFSTFAAPKDNVDLHVKQGKL